MAATWCDVWVPCSSTPLHSIIFTVFTIPHSFITAFNTLHAYRLPLSLYLPVIGPWLWNHVSAFG